MKRKKIRRTKVIERNKYVVAWIEVHQNGDKFYNRVGLAYSAESTEHAAIGDVVKSLTGAYRSFLIRNIVCSRLP